MSSFKQATFLPCLKGAIAAYAVDMEKVGEENPLRKGKSLEKG
jgi:hypothetical protein